MGKETETTSPDPETVCQEDNGKVNPPEKIVRKRKFTWTPKRKEAFKKCVEANRKRKKDHGKEDNLASPPPKTSKPHKSPSRPQDESDTTTTTTTQERSSSSDDEITVSTSSSSSSMSSDSDSDSESEGEKACSKPKSRRCKTSKKTSKKARKSYSRKKTSGGKKEILGTLKKMKKMIRRRNSKETTKQSFEDNDPDPVSDNNTYSHFPLFRYI